MANAEEWRARAVKEIVELLEREVAATQPEMEAKISDAGTGASGRLHGGRPQPHHLTTARLRLLEAGVIESPVETTRGGKTVRTYSLVSAPARRAERVAARKRLLHARFQSWSDPAGEWKPPPVPSALEWIVNASLVEAAPRGYHLMGGDRGQVQSLFGERVPGGSMDNAAWYSPLDGRGYPSAPVLMLVEAKNVRQWIYPGTQEMYQLLSKCAALQVAHPGQSFLPVLVCRQVQRPTMLMAKQMGFYVINTWRQYVRPVVVSGENGQRLFDEVDAELGYNLALHEDSVVEMVRHFTTALPRYVSEGAPVRWGQVVAHPAVPELLLRLRDDSLKGDGRKETLHDLGTAVEAVTGEDARWKPASEQDVDVDEVVWDEEDDDRGE